MSNIDEGKKRCFSSQGSISEKKRKRISMNALNESINERGVADLFYLPRRLGQAGSRQHQMNIIRQAEGHFSATLTGLDGVQLQSHEDDGEYCTLLCSFEEEEGKIRAEVVRCHQLRLDCRTPSTATATDSANTQVSLYEKPPPDKNTSHMLDLLFGNARAQKQQRMHFLRERHSDSLLSSIHESLKDVESLGGSRSEIDEGKLKMLERVLPRFNNENAQKPQDIYNIDDICTDDELAHYDKLINNDILQTDTNLLQQQLQDRCGAKGYFYHHVLHLKSLLKTRSEENTMEKVVELEKHDALIVRKLRLLYMFNDLLILYQSIFVSKNYSKFYEVRKSLSQRCVREFCSEQQTDQSNARPSTTTIHNVSKLLNYMFILALTIDDYCTDISFFQSDLQMNANKLINLFKAIGCSIRQSKPNYMAILSAPLKLNPYAFVTSSRTKLAPTKRSLTKSQKT